MNAKTARWRKLDNAAKIFPATSGRIDTRVFRFSCELNETIVGTLLQTALDKTMKVFPIFCSVMRKGFFWYYLEKSRQRPQVEVESRPPCSSIYIPDQKSLLFKVTYYKSRINFEVYHALTDGTGAMQFLKELVKNYIMEAHSEEIEEEILLLDETITIHDKEDDSFAKYYTKTEKRKKKKIRSFQIKGMHTEPGQFQIMEGAVSVKELLQKSRKYGVSVSVFLTSIFLCAVHQEMSRWDERHPVVLMVPVNLRKYFPSESMLNFFSWIEPGYRFESGVSSFEDVLEQVRVYFEEELTKEKITSRMNELIRLERNPLLRITPLELKNICLQAGARLAKKNVTAILSNMGVVDMPEVYRKYIREFHVFTSTPKIEMCMCSFEDRMVMSFTSRFENINIQRNFFQILENEGIAVSIKEPDYPKPEKPVYQEQQFFKWFSFLCIVAVAIGVMANAILTPDLNWSLIMAGGGFSIWLTLAIGIYKRRNLLKNAMWQLLLITVGSIIWDISTGWHGWSVDYVFPGITLLTNIFMIIITRVQRLEVKEYMIYYIMISLVGLIPVLLLLMNVLTVTYPSVIMGGISFLFLITLIIFKRKAFMMELYKKMHI